jgi:plastocyanin
VVEMLGTSRGERVWFAPQGLAVAPGTTLRFVNKDAGNSHTSTAYHPELYDRPRRIPPGAAPWDSGFLMPEESFEVTLEQPGVYDYYCLPHEMAGMVGRIVVGRPTDAGSEQASGDAGRLPEAALAAFPPVEKILAATRIDLQSSK